MSGFGAWRTEEADTCPPCTNACRQGRDCPNGQPMFDSDPAADLFIKSVLVAAAAVLALIFAGVWA